MKNNKSKTKYRIILQNKLYYPQYKSWIFWHYIYEVGLLRFCFCNLENAKKFVESRADYQQKRFFEIVKIYDKS